MTNIAAIDIGSNAIRLIVARLGKDGTYEVTFGDREAIRLGKDVFSTGKVSPENIVKCREAFRKFRQKLDDFGVKNYRAVGTSALRDATNRKSLLKSIKSSSNINIEVVTGQEEARLVGLAVCSKINLKNKLALLVDIGGGSIELTVTLNGDVVSTDSLNMGTVRFLQVLEQKKRGVDILRRLSKAYANSLRRRIKKDIDKKDISIVVATGGTVDNLGVIGKELFGEKDSGRISSDTLEIIYKKVSALNIEERIAQLGLKPDRADVVLPALIILCQVVKLSKAKEIVIPNVGVKEGVILDIISDGVGHRESRLQREQLVNFSIELGRKFHFDEDHARNVAAISLQIFDKTQKLHNLSKDYRVLLELAGLLHDCGNCVNINDHHKHSQYLINSTDFFGLNPEQKHVVGCIARYHRKSCPKMKHPEFAGLSSQHRKAVEMLASILRIAEGLGSQDTQKDINLKFYIKPPKVLMKLESKEDVTMEKYSVLERIQPFEKAFKLKLLVR